MGISDSFTTVVFSSFVDYFDIGIYLKYTLLTLEGGFPYTSAEFQYPILAFVPMMIAAIPALLFQNAMAFFFTFQALMVLCDIVTVLCVYLICLKLFNEKTALLAGLIYAAAFAAAYFVITKYDAFPAALLMLALLFTIYGHSAKGYAVSVIGAFAKVFPGIALPFLILFNAKKTSLREEIIAALKVGGPVFIILFVPLFVLYPETLKIYLPIRSELGYYSNTLTFTLYSWFHDVFGLSISIDLVSAGMYLLMGAGFLILLFIAWKLPQRDAVLMLKLILCAIVLVVFCAKVRSPQYIVWFTPLLCILAVDDSRKIAALFVFQALAYIEFPLMFGAYYTALTYTGPVMSGGWMVTLGMFTLMYLSLLACVWLVVDPPKIVSSLRKAMQAPAA
ncbi:MAG: hypothetical protein CW742_13280 [Methanoregula sp.]|nr:MAG: hypothetical protein CW742_13280 [Methanoregula sp.]